ncbi:hypothetical protein B0T16DRAFT_392293 [Cercophora newfieldiana]|uniref:Uncharacterized protein n=1 Tax=Cercophora newfieldiana TaxID=92897 RepID=A0AA39Y0N7_9PEZI|nr:hypothetical protein B0T16DRAFT_392293 [Cercophora newfieldiana]
MAIPWYHLKSCLPRNGMAWGNHDHVMRTRRRDRTVRLVLERLGVRTRPREVQVFLCGLVDSASDLIGLARCQGMVIDETEFLEQLWESHPLGKQLSGKYFAEFFHVLLRGRMAYLEDREDRGLPTQLEAEASGELSDDEDAGAALFAAMPAAAAAASTAASRHAAAAHPPASYTAGFPTGFTVDGPGLAFRPAPPTLASTITAATAAPAAPADPDVVLEWDSDEFVGFPPSSGEEDDEEEETDDLRDVRAGIGAMQLGDAMDVDE